MPAIRFSERAEEDLFEIALYTVRRWGQEQSDRYLSDLEGCFTRLIDNPLLGRECEEIDAGLRRLEHNRHVIFYRCEGRSILITRVLHRSMLPRWQVFD